MVKWWLPWLLPVAIAVAVMVTVISTLAATVVFVAICFVGLPALRLRYLKAHPGNPELVHKPFWRF
jgi:hypothetical protein